MTLVHVGSIDYGDAGVMQTLRAMATLVNDGVNDPLVLQFARRMAVSSGARMYQRQAYTIRQWLATVWRFVDDPPDRELLVSPAESLREYMRYGTISGDCDEVATLGATLGKAMGLQADFVALAFFNPDGTPGRYEHVYATVTTPSGATVDLDITRPGLVPPVARDVTVAV